MYRSFTIIVISISLLVLPNFWGYPPATAANRPGLTIMNWDSFDPALFEKIQSMDQLVGYIDSTYKGSRNSPEFIDHIASIISRRFCHGYSHYSEYDNWVADLSGKYVWDDLSAIVLPDDILQHRRAACSQQTIILMECCRHYGLDYRRVSFDHHFASEIRVNGHWVYTDVNLEVFGNNKSLEELMKTGSFYSLYSNKLPARDMYRLLAHHRYGQVNAKPAPRALIFQKASYYISQYFICILSLILSLFYYLYLVRKKTNPLL